MATWISCHHPPLPYCRMAGLPGHLHSGPWGFVRNPPDPRSDHTPIGRSRPCRWPKTSFGTDIPLGGLWPVPSLREMLQAGTLKGAPSCEVRGLCPFLQGSVLFFLLLEGCVPSSPLPPRIPNGNPKWECPCCLSPSSPTLGSLHPPSSASTCLFLILDVIEGGKCDRKEGRLFFPPAKYGLTLKIQILSRKESQPLFVEGEKAMFSGFSVPAGKFRKEWWSPCREPQEFTELVHRTLSAASYAKKKLLIPSLPARGLGGALL